MANYRMKRDNRKLLRFVVGLLTLPSATLAEVEPHALVARGYEPTQVYAVGEQDAVNLFNGNLVYTVPIGPEYPVAAGFSYRFSLVYNSHIWEYTNGCGGELDLTEVKPLPPPDDPDDPLSVANEKGCTKGVPNPWSNAGTSWIVSLGELQSMGHSFSRLTFVEPDGQSHEFSAVEGGQSTDDYLYSFDSSRMLRMKTIESNSDGAPLKVEIDTPEGLTYRFARGTASIFRWDLKHINDRWGNSVTLTMAGSTLTITDSTDRSHTIVYRTSAPGLNHIASVNLANANGSRSTFLFNYSERFIVPACPHDYPDPDAPPKPWEEKVVLLNSLQLPDGSDYTFTYAEETVDSFCSTVDGRLESVTLPTRGTIDYEYGLYTYPPSSCDRSPVRNGVPPPDIWLTQTGVTQRTMTNTGGGSWTRHYRNSGLNWGGRHFNPDASTCELPFAVYTDVWEPTGETDFPFKLERHFFSAFKRAGSVDPRQDGWDHREYGLSMDRYYPDSRNPDRARSSMVFACSSGPSPSSYTTPPWNDKLPISSENWPDTKRHVWVPPQCIDPGMADNTTALFEDPDDVRGLRDRYVSYSGGSALCDGVPTTGSCEHGFWKQNSEITYFNDDELSMAPTWIATNRSDHDGFGHFRTVSTSSHAGIGGNTTVTVDYNKNKTDPSQFSAWLPNLYSTRTISGSGKTLTERFVFDTLTGALNSHTRVRTGGNLTTSYVRDSGGNPCRTIHSGGDSGADVRNEYRIRHEYTAGALSRSEFITESNFNPATCDGSNERIVLRTIDIDVDEDTGMPDAFYDSSGVKTSLIYDNSWRPELIFISGNNLPDAATTRYDYSKATATEDAKIVVTQANCSTKTACTTATAITTEELRFDGFGRLHQERTTMPSGQVSIVSRSYTPRGAVKTVDLPRYDGDPILGKQQTNYDVFGRPTEEKVVNPATDEITQQVKYGYLGIRRTTVKNFGLTDSQGSQTCRGAQMFHDQRGNLVEVWQTPVTDGNKCIISNAGAFKTFYEYDPADRLTKVEQDGAEATQVRLFGYDGAGLPVSETHPELDGTIIVYGGFDAFGQATEQSYGGNPSFDLRTTHDGAGRVVSITNGFGDVLQENFYTNEYGTEAYKSSPATGNGKLFQTKRHNRFDRNIVVTQTNRYAGVAGSLSRLETRTGGSFSVPRARFETTFEYDLLGNLTEVTYPRCLQAGCSMPSRTISYGYKQGMLTHVASPSFTNGSRAIVEYYANQQPSVLRHPNDIEDEFGRDEFGLARPKSIEALDQSNSLWSSGAFKYDGVGNITEIGSDRFVYESRYNRLIKSTVAYPGGTDVRDYDYDELGNITNIRINGFNRPVNVDSGTNRLNDPVDVDYYDYDVAGRLTRHGSWKYFYDALGMMTSVGNEQTSGTGIVQRYVYGGDGERLLAIDVVDGSNDAELWTLRGAGTDVLRDLSFHRASGWAWKEDYVHTGLGLLAAFENVGAGEIAKHYHINHLGSPRLITDENGNELSQHVYSPFGEELTDSWADSGRLRFTGHERDDIDGTGDQAADLDYMHARNYSPHLARFTQMDPLLGEVEDPQSWNRYAYAMNNPVSLVDLDGQDESSSTCESDETCNTSSESSGKGKKKERKEKETKKGKQGKPDPFDVERPEFFDAINVDAYGPGQVGEGRAFPTLYDLIEAKKRELGPSTCEGSVLCEFKGARRELKYVLLANSGPWIGVGVIVGGEVVAGLRYGWRAINAGRKICEVGKGLNYEVFERLGGWNRVAQILASTGMYISAAQGNPAKMNPGGKYTNQESRAIKAGIKTCEILGKVGRKR